MTASNYLVILAPLIKDFNNKPKYVYERDDVLIHFELPDLAKFKTEIISCISEESKHISSPKV